MGDAVRGRRRRARTSALVLALVLGGCGTAPAPTPVPATPTPAATATTSASASAAPSSSPVPATPLPSFGSGGTVVLVGNDGSLRLVGADGDVRELASNAQGTHAFPAWSPDGTRVAALRYGSRGTSIVVWDIERGDDEPLELVTSSTIGAFYLSWAPDGARIAYLADTPEGLALRVVATDGSDAVDGSDPGATVRVGSPFYAAWTDAEHLFAHVETGPDAFLAEIGLDGEPSSPPLGTPGEFRPPVVTADGSHVGYVRTTDDAAEVILAPRADPEGPVALAPLVGIAALATHPRDDVLATIGQLEPSAESFAFPIGPLRLLEADGEVRELLDGSVVGFWWSPDGSTIAALRLQAESADGPTQVRLLFVDVASGDVDAQAFVRPAALFVDQLLPFFDQYALSHALWAPDSSSLLLPVVGDDGVTRVAVMPRDGGEVVLLDGAIGFWSPPPALGSPAP